MNSLPRSSLSGELLVEDEVNAKELGTSDDETGLLLSHLNAPNARLPHPRRHYTLLRSSCRELIPTFLRRGSDGQPEKPPSPTAFLDGIRGVAAYCVMHQHFLQRWTTSIFFCHGHPSETRSLLQLPFVRLLFSGSPMVLVFFVVSGYTLSVGPLRARRARGSNAMLSSLSSSVFRRGIRLLLPPWIVMLVFMHLVWMGFCDKNRAFTGHGHNGALPPRFESYAGYWKAYARMVADMAGVFSWRQHDVPTFDMPLWTIKVEFMCSLFLYQVMVSTARVKPAVRLAMYLGMMGYLVYWFRWELLPFIGGLFLAEIDDLTDVFRRDETLTVDNATDLTEKRPHLVRRYHLSPSTCFWTLNFICSLFLLSMPLDGSAQTPAYAWLYRLTPANWKHPVFDRAESISFWWAIGALQLIATCSRCPPFRKIFTCAVSQYLGKISYALYMLHAPLLYTIGDGFGRIMEPWIGDDSFSSTKKWTVIGMEYILVLTWLLFLSDIVWRLVDAKSVEFAKYVQKRCFMLHV